MINLGQNWGVKDSGLLAYKQVGSKYFNKDFDFTRASSGTYIDKNGVLQEIATNVPRVDFSDGVGALLLEPQRSNVLLKSNQFDDWGLGSGYTITPNQQGIYGSNDAFLVSKNTDQNYYINQSASITGDYTISIYAKANTADGVFIYTTNAYGGFNLQNGTFISGGGGYTGQSIQSIGNGWYRCSVNGTGPVSSLLVKPVDSNNQNIAGSIYVQHAQIESGSYPTSIIETTTSQVTRIADVANNCGTEQDFNSEEGVLYAEIKRFNGDTSTTTLSINDGSVSNMVSFYYFSTDKVYFDILSSSPNVSGFVAVDDTFSFNKIALKYKSGDIAIWINGQEVLTRTNTISLSGLNELSLSYGDNTALLNGKVRSVKYFPEALTDEQLENLTK